MKSTIIFCCNSLWGLVNFRGRVIRQFVEDGHRVVLIAPPDFPAERATSLGAEFVAWSVSPRGTTPWREVAAITSLIRIYREIGPHIAFHYTIKAVMYGAIAARLSGTRFVSVVTGLGYAFLKNNWKQRLAKLLYRATLGRSLQVWFLNRDDREFFEQAGLVNAMAVQTLPGEGIDVDHFAPAPLPSNQRVVFLMIARLVKDKGVIEFGEAARQVRRDHPETIFRLLGPAYSANAMSVPASVVQDWEREGAVEYLGATDDVRQAIRESHCVVLPSYREGMPRVLMEAAAMGRPSITSDVTGCRDVIISGRTGILCNPKSAESLAQACRQFLSMSPTEAQEMGEHARQHAHREFDDQVVIDIYRSLIASL